MIEEQVILVNERDEPIGLMNKMEAHEKKWFYIGLFQCFVLNEKNEVMLQQRAHHKYHSPLYGPILVVVINVLEKPILKLVKRRLSEEMGFQTNLKELFHFIYKAPFDNGLTEHELDHVMIGYYNEAPIINPEEVENWKWMSSYQRRYDFKS